MNSIYHYKFIQMRRWVSLLALSGAVMVSQAQTHEDHDGHDDGGAPHGEHTEDADSHEGHDEHEEIVRLSPEVLEEFGIELGQAGPGVLHEQVVLPGEIRFNRETLAYATPRYEGTVLSIKVRLADRVTKGQVLATLESTGTLRPFEITAPFDGVIVAYDITPGQTVEAGAALFTVADLSTVWADLQIYQRNLMQIHEGLPVRIVGGHDLSGYSGTIAYISPTVDEHTRTGLARVVVDNPEGAWRPGLFIKGIVSTDEHPVDLMVPRTAVLKFEGKTVVFVREGDGFEPRPVQLGHSDDTFYAVESGLEQGETIVLRNGISLKAELGKGSFGGHGHAH